MNCPFYGRALYQTRFAATGPQPFVLIDSRGNQCAVVTDSHSPCRMEIHGEVPDWKTCPLVRDIRMEGDT
jgi:hypothetical protein